MFGHIYKEHFHQKVSLFKAFTGNSMFHRCMLYLYKKTKYMCVVFITFNEMTKTFLYHSNRKMTANGSRQIHGVTTPLSLHAF